jgi:diguanylate cyclase (GGDEF)-like protein
LALLLIDVDHFKAINDRYGHLTGDHVLQQLAKLVNGVVPGDTVVRYGGEEIAVILAETDLGEACAAAEGLRREVEAARMSFLGNAVSVTVSIGCAELAAGDAGPRDLVARADEALYRAKRGGRNGLCR